MRVFGVLANRWRVKKCVETSMAEFELNAARQLSELSEQRNNDVDQRSNWRPATDGYVPKRLL